MSLKLIAIALILLVLGATAASAVYVNVTNKELQIVGTANPMFYGVITTNQSVVYVTNEPASLNKTLAIFNAIPLGNQTITKISGNLLTL